MCVASVCRLEAPLLLQHPLVNKEEKQQKQTKKHTESTSLILRLSFDCISMRCYYFIGDKILQIHIIVCVYVIITIILLSGAIHARKTQTVPHSCVCTYSVYIYIYIYIRRLYQYAPAGIHAARPKRDREIKKRGWNCLPCAPFGSYTPLIHDVAHITTVI